MSRPTLLRVNKLFVKEGSKDGKKVNEGNKFMI